MKIKHLESNLLRVIVAILQIGKQHDISHEISESLE